MFVELVACDTKWCAFPIWSLRELVNVFHEGVGVMISRFCTIANLKTQ